MDYNEKIKQLQKLKRSKTKEFKITLNKYSTKGQKVISFDEVCRLKEELEEISNLIIALKRVFRKI